MNRSVFTFATAALLAAGSAQANLIISEIVDASLSGGLPKYIEITNTSGSDISLDGYFLSNVNSTDGNSFEGLALTGTITAGDSLVYSYENSDAPGASTFFDTYGFDADNLEAGSFFNGDDTLILSFGAQTVTGTGGDSVDWSLPANADTIVDIFGVLGVDGTGEDWEYADGYAVRNFNITSGSSTLDLSEWTLSGPDGLEIGDDTAEVALILAETTPGTHSFVPEPSSLALLGLGGLLVARRRRG